MLSRSLFQALRLLVLVPSPPLSVSLKQDTLARKGHLVFHWCLYTNNIRDFDWLRVMQFKYKGRDTLGDKSQRHVPATSCSVCTTCKTSRCDTTPVRSTRSDLVWGGMWTSFLIQYGWPYDALSLVHLYFVAATCCGKSTHDATTLLSLILSLWLVARI